MKLYIAGPIAKFGSDLSTPYQRFEGAKALLSQAGYEGVNPMDILPECAGGPSCPGLRERSADRHARACFLKWDIIGMLKCDGVALLDDWKESSGAREEVSIADYVKMPVRLVRQWAGLI